MQYFEQLTDQGRDSMMHFAQEIMGIIRRSDLVALYTQVIQPLDDHQQPYIQRALDALSDRTGAPDAFNFGLNDGPEAGQSVYHLHLHLMPRWKGDAPNPRGGVRNLFTHDSYYNK